MPVNLIAPVDGSVPLTLLAGEAALSSWLDGKPDTIGNWIAANGFTAKAGETCLLADQSGQMERVLVGLGDEEADLWTFAALRDALPDGSYHLEESLENALADQAALGWALQGYRFDRYRSADETSDKSDKDDGPYLIWPQGCRRQTILHSAQATFLVRDLINTPASDMGPAQLAEAALALSENHNGDCRIIVGDDLLEGNFPGIHAVGRASSQSPRLIDLHWGKPGDPKVTLVGKGVCFDSGGLDLKPASNMKLMKKDMGGAAHVLGLASLVMAEQLPVRLRVLIPAVENSVSGNAMRPLDVITMRSGKTVEIGHTDAEGRVVLADALALASEEKPDLLIDMATLTGAARVALGTEVPALFTDDDVLAGDLARLGEIQNDALWRLPLWKPYKKQVKGKVADLNNAPEGGYGGAITAALFLQAFVGEGISWTHIDLMAWNISSQPGRPEGGEAMSLRAIYSLLEERFAP